MSKSKKPEKVKKENPRVSDWYDRVVTSLEKCVFCDLKEKYIIAEEGGLVLAVNLFPYTDGHLLIIPIRHIEIFSDFSDAEWRAVRNLTKLGIELLKTCFRLEDSNILYREGGIGSGKSLGHAHFHIMPCTPGFLDRNESGIYYKYQDLQLTPLETAEKLRAAKDKNVVGKDGSGSTDAGFMRQACLLCDRSKCGYKIGCVIVKDGDVISEGWNETLPGEIYCQNGVCIREAENLKAGKEPDKVCSIHAEAAAIAEAACRGVSVEGSDVYVSTYPCVICCRLLAKSKIQRLFYMTEYTGGRVGEPLLKAAGIDTIKLNEKEVWG